MMEPRISGLERFSSAAQHYLLGRAPYAPRLIRRVALLCGLSASDHILDLGCGPAQIAVAFAPLVGRVTAVDPEPAMLEIAARHAETEAVAIDLVRGSSDALDEVAGRFRMAAIGRAFHWMDRTATLAALDARIEPGGAVVLFGDEHPELAENGWRKPFWELLHRHAADRAAETLRTDPNYRQHEAVLLDSAFSEIETISVWERRRTPVEHFVHRALSLSSTSPHRLADRGAALSAEIRTLMDRYATDARVPETVASIAVIARRPG